MTRLEAVNYILNHAMGIRPVPALDTSGPSSAGDAERTLVEAERSIQASGWEFNTARDQEIVLNGSSKAALPADTLWVESAEGDRIIDRNGFVFDLDTQTDVLTANPKVNYTVLVSWTNTPVVVRRYIAAVAARMHFERWGNKDPMRLNVLITNEHQAKADATRADNRGGQVNVVQSASAWKFRGGRSSGTPFTTY